VQDFVQKLFLILRDSVKMNEYQDDTEMMADMHYRIAQGYMNAPDLRLASLDTLQRLQLFRVILFPISFFFKQKQNKILQNKRIKIMLRLPIAIFTLLHWFLNV